MSVHRCVCFQHTFGRLKKAADSYGWKKVSDITRATGCGSGCGGCVPYLKAMLDTGATTFSVRGSGSGTPVPCEPDQWDDLTDSDRPFLYFTEPNQ